MFVIGLLVSLQNCSDTCRWHCVCVFVSASNHWTEPVHGGSTHTHTRTHQQAVDLWLLVACVRVCLLACHLSLCMCVSDPWHAHTSYRMCVCVCLLACLHWNMQQLCILELCIMALTNFLLVCTCCSSSSSVCETSSLQLTPLPAALVLWLRSRWSSFESHLHFFLHC